MKINQKNDNDERTGWWEMYYATGIISYKGYYVNGNRDGYREDYNFNGTLNYIGHFKNNLRTGWWQYYNNDGTQYKQTYYI